MTEIITFGNFKGGVGKTTMPLKPPMNYQNEGRRLYF